MNLMKIVLKSLENIGCDSTSIAEHLRIFIKTIRTTMLFLASHIIEIKSKKSCKKLLNLKS